MSLKCAWSPDEVDVGAIFSREPRKKWLVGINRAPPRCPPKGPLKVQTQLNYGKPAVPYNQPIFLFQFPKAYENFNVSRVFLGYP